jgi:hypothetical protein
MWSFYQRGPYNYSISDSTHCVFPRSQSAKSAATEDGENFASCAWSVQLLKSLDVRIKKNARQLRCLEASLWSQSTKSGAIYMYQMWTHAAKTEQSYPLWTPSSRLACKRPCHYRNRQPSHHIMFVHWVIIVILLLGSLRAWLHFSLVLLTQNGDYNKWPNE